MNRKMRKNQFFSDLGDKGKIRFRTTVLQFILVRRLFCLFVCFKERRNKNSFENLRKDAIKMS